MRVEYHRSALNLYIDRFMHGESIEICTKVFVCTRFIYDYLGSKRVDHKPADAEMSTVMVVIFLVEFIG